MSVAASVYDEVVKGWLALPLLLVKVLPQLDESTCVPVLVTVPVLVKRLDVGPLK